MRTVSKYVETKSELQRLRPRSLRRVVVQSRLKGLMTQILQQENRRDRRKSK